VSSRGSRRRGRRSTSYLTWDHADDGSLLLRARLPAEEGAVVLAALRSAVRRLADGASAEAPSRQGGSEEERWEAPEQGSLVESASAEAPELRNASAEALALQDDSAEAPTVA